MRVKKSPNPGRPPATSSRLLFAKGQNSASHHSNATTLSDDNLHLSLLIRPSHPSPVPQYHLASAGSLPNPKARKVALPVLPQLPEVSLFLSLPMKTMNPLGQGLYLIHPCISLPGRAISTYEMLNKHLILENWLCEWCSTNTGRRGSRSRHIWRFLYFGAVLSILLTLKFHPDEDVLSF